MGNFFVSVTVNDMAAQVAAMVNKYNRWSAKFHGQALLSSKGTYFVELDGQKVIGCASCIKDFENISKIQHICVLPEYRGRGLAKRLTNLAIKNCGTEYVYMTIREDNIESLALANSLRFRYANKHWFRDHWTLTFGRRCDEGF